MEKIKARMVGPLAPPVPRQCSQAKAIEGSNIAERDIRNILRKALIAN